MQIYDLSCFSIGEDGGAAGQDFSEIKDRDAQETCVLLEHKSQIVEKVSDREWKWNLGGASAEKEDGVRGSLVMVTCWP